MNFTLPLDVKLFLFIAGLMHFALSFKIFQFFEPFMVYSVDIFPEYFGTVVIDRNLFEQALLK